MTARDLGTVAESSTAKPGTLPETALRQVPEVAGVCDAASQGDKGLPPLPRSSMGKLRQEKAKGAAEGDLDLRKRKERDGALTWETAAPLETPPALAKEAGDAQNELNQAEGAGPEHAIASIFRVPLASVHEQHLASLVAQLLTAERVSDVSTWCPIITCLAMEAADCISPSAVTACGIIDPRAYIKVKRLPDNGTPEDSCVVQGLVCRKNLTHRKMRKRISNPRILMLGSMLEFHRTQGRLASFDHYTKDQETEHLRLAVERLADMAPDVLLVEKSVARDAQDALLNRGISLALNVKRSVLDSLARCTGAQVAPSVGQLNHNCMAFCKEFEVEEFALPPSLAQVASSLPSNGSTESKAGLSAVPAVFKEQDAGRAISAAEAGRGPAAGSKQAAAGSLEQRSAPAAALARESLAAASRDSLAGSRDALASARSVAQPSARELAARALSSRDSDESTRPPIRSQDSSKMQGPRTLMSFKGCPRALGCTVILKGGPLEDLTCVKKVMQFANYCAYRKRLETAFLATELASAAAAETSPIELRHRHGHSIADSVTSQLEAMAISPEGKLANGAGRQQPAGGDAKLGWKLGTAWSSEGAGKGVGSENDPAMAALTMQSAGAAQGEDADADGNAGTHMTGRSEEQILDDADRIVQQTFQIAKAARHDGAIMSASPFTSEECQEDSAAANASRAEDSTPEPSPGREYAELYVPPSTPSSQGGVSEALHSLRGLSPLTPRRLSLEPLDPLSLAARELMMMRQASQASSAFLAALEEEDLVDKEEREAAGQVLEHQRIFVSVARRNPGKSLLCEPPKIQRIDFYEASDVPLATFLATSSPQQQKKCPMAGCGEASSSHMHSYLHSSGLITFSVAQLPEGKELPGGDRGQIWFWARPKEAGSHVNETVRRVLLPPEASCISFGHFLELGLCMDECRVHGRPLHRMFARYFGIGSMVACFHYEHVAPNEVLVPPPQIAYSVAAQQRWLEDEVEELIEEANSIFGSINEALSKLVMRARMRPHSPVAPPTDKEEAALLLLAQELASDGEALSTAIMDICSTVRAESAANSPQKSPGPGGVDSKDANTVDNDMLVAALWTMNRMRQRLAAMALTWASRLHQPTAAAASLSISRQNSVDFELASSSLHSRHASIEQAKKADLLDDSYESQTMSSGHLIARQASGASPVASTRNASASAHAPEQGRRSPVDQSVEAGRGMAGTAAEGSLATSTSATIAPAKTSGNRGAEVVDRPAASGTEIGAMAAANEESGTSSEQNGSFQKEADNVESSDGGMAIVQRRVDTSIHEPAREATDMPLSISPGRQALLASGKVSERVAALEKEHPVLRAISMPAWSRTIRQRSATDAVLSWLNAGRRGMPFSQGTSLQAEAAGEAQQEAEAEDSGSSSGDNTSEIGSEAASGSTASPEYGRRERTASGKSSGSPTRWPRDDRLEKVARTRAGIAAELGRVEGRRSAELSRAEGRRSAELSRVEGRRSADIPRSPFKDTSFQDKVAPTSKPKAPEGKVAGAVEAAQAAIRSTGSLPNLGAPEMDDLEETRLLMREDSQLTSHFDVGYWDHMLKAQGSGSIDQIAGSLGQQPHVQGDANPLPDSKSFASQSSLPVPTSLLLPPPATSSPSPVLSDALSSLNLPLPSALSSILTSRKVESAPGLSTLPSGAAKRAGRALLPVGVDERVVVVRDDEPTSVVAYFLSTREYQAYLDDGVACILYSGPKPGSSALRALRGNNSGSDLPAIEALTSRPILAETQASGSSVPKLQGLSSSNVDLPSLSNPPLNDLSKGAITVRGKGGKDGTESAASDPAADWRVLLSSEPLHFQHSLTDESGMQPSSKAKLQVTAWFAPQFAELRRRCCVGGEVAFVSSLSRCRPWEARGGKTRAYFAKTADDRYIVKQLQAMEKKSFQEIAPAYFKYLAQSMRRQQPTCLAKIMGVYTVTVRQAGAKEVPMDILVMENIFYDRELFPIYDLKGSERARLARDDPSDPTRVLLDQNLKQSNMSSPILVKQEAFAELEKALWADTAFLSALGVMDYSLLVGVDKTRNVLVVGIIDFIRQYTWDKALEKWVKSGMGLSKDLKAPTIQSPKEYCRRFRAAMSSYFTRVPSHDPPPDLLDPESNLEVLSWKGAS